MKIGIFDSGIGGLSVLHRALKELPDAEFIYYADTKNVPYGEKPKELVLELVENIVNFMASQNVDAVVVACNTATSVAINDLREKFDFPIIGMEPAVKKALEDYPEKRTLVFATPITVQGEKMKYLLERVDQDHLVDMVPTPGLVRFAEKGIFEGTEVEDYILEQLKGFDLNNYSSLVLGCTHFNYFKKTLNKLLPDTIHFVDGIEGTVMQLKRMLSYNTNRDSSDTKGFSENVTYYFSGSAASFEELQLTKSLMKILDSVENL